MKITIVRQLNNSFKVAHDYDYEEAKKLKVGVEYQCEIKRPRNYEFHKKYFALIKMVFDNQEKYINMDHLRKDLTIASGFYTKRFDLNNNEVLEADSISFSSMDRDKFNELYSRTLDSIVMYFHFDKQDIVDNVEQYF